MMKGDIALALKLRKTSEEIQHEFVHHLVKLELMTTEKARGYLEEIYLCLERLDGALAQLRYYLCAMLAIHQKRELEEDIRKHILEMKRGNKKKEPTPTEQAAEEGEGSSGESSGEAEGKDEEKKPLTFKEKVLLCKQKSIEWVKKVRDSSTHFLAGVSNSADVLASAMKAGTDVPFRERMFAARVLLFVDDIDSAKLSGLVKAIEQARTDYNTLQRAMLVLLHDTALVEFKGASDITGTAFIDKYKEIEGLSHKAPKPHIRKMGRTWLPALRKSFHYIAESLHFSLDDYYTSVPDRYVLGLTRKIKGYHDASVTSLASIEGGFLTHQQQAQALARKAIIETKLFMDGV